MITHQATASLNNHGVNLIEQGDVQGAKKAFAAAVRDLCWRSEGPDDNDACSGDEYFVSSRPVLQVASWAPGSSQIAFVPSRPIKILLPAAENDSDSEDPLAATQCLSATIVFNIACMHHHNAATESNIGSDINLLSKAHSLYAKAWSMLDQMGAALPGSSGYALVDVLIMSILNNMAHLCLLLADYGQYQTYVDLLVGYANTVNCSSQPEQQGEQVSRMLASHKSFFLSNAHALRPMVLAPAA